MLEGRKIELEHSANDANVSILSCDSLQPIIANLPVQLQAGFLNTSDVATWVTVHAYK